VAIRRVFFAVLFLCTLGCGVLQGAPVSVSAVPAQEEIVAGESFWVGLSFKVDDGWHIYWKNPGEAGMAPAIDWDLPKGFTVEEVRWPSPTRFEENGIVAFGYDKDTTLLARIHAPQKLTVGDRVPIEVKANWVACKDQCVPLSGSQSLEFQVVETADGGLGQLASAHAALPKALEAQLQKTGDRLSLDVPMQLENAYFVPEKEGAAHIDLSGSTLSASALDGKALKGVLVNGGDTFEIDTSVKGGGFPFLGVLGLAFLGGLVLNLMPCVLPVISLKILGFVEVAGSSRRKALKHGLEFTAGVLVSFWILTGALLLLRTFGQSVGWGFQLQEPIFVVILSMVLFLLSLSLFGVFEFGTKLGAMGGTAESKLGKAKTFFSGVLATLVATPCTGPFLASAVGYAMTLPTILCIIVFTAMALGMALPYLLLAAFPAALRFLPKPGPWMVTFKQAMGFIMMATVIWLLWVFAAQVDMMIAVMALLVGFLLLSIGAWVFGRWGNAAQKKRRRLLATSFALLCTVGAVGVGIRAARIPAPPTALLSAAEAIPGQWVTWEKSQFEQMRAEGKPMLVDFTAKWCLVCQANKVALNSSDVKQKAQEEGVMLLEADWTRHDDAITAELEKFGRNSVPLYVYYPAGGGDPVVLPQMLTSGAILDSIK
jgi:thiol:disulfide interchange protein